MINEVPSLTIEKEKEDRPRGGGKVVDRVKGLGCLGKEPPEHLISVLEESNKLMWCCVVMVGISKNEEMMVEYEPCFCRDLKGYFSNRKNNTRNKSFNVKRKKQTKTKNNNKKQPHCKGDNSRPSLTTR